MLLLGFEVVYLDCFDGGLVMLCFLRCAVDCGVLMVVCFVCFGVIMFGHATFSF